MTKKPFNKQQLPRPFRVLNEGKKKQEFHLTLNDRLAKYLVQASGRMGINRTHLMAIALEYFWHNHPIGGGQYTLFADDKTRIYAILQRNEDDQLLLSETGTYTTTIDSLLEDMRERYPALELGRTYGQTKE